MTKTLFIFISKSLVFHPGYSKRLVCQLLLLSYCFQDQKKRDDPCHILICMVKTIVCSLHFTLTGCDTQHFNRITSIQICPFLWRSCQGKILTSAIALKRQHKTAEMVVNNMDGLTQRQHQKSSITLIKYRQRHMVSSSKCETTGFKNQTEDIYIPTPLPLKEGLIIESFLKCKFSLTPAN